MKQFLKSPQARIAFLHDMTMAAAALPLSLYLRLGNGIQWIPVDYIYLAVAIFVGICAPVFYFSRLYRGVWRYASMADLTAIAKAATLAVLIFLPILFSITRLEFLPRSVPIIQWFVLVTLLGAPRFFYRIVKDRRLDRILEANGHRKIPALLIGAGDEAELFIREQKRNPNAVYDPVALVSEKSTRVGREIHGIPIIASINAVQPDDWKSLKQAPQKLILTKDTLDGALVRSLFDLAQSQGMSLARLPKLSELKEGLRDEQQAVRPIAVEDLLGRPQANLDRGAMRAMVQGRRVLVTGAGGTIGAELTRQICAHGPSEIILLDSSEYQLYLIDQEVGTNHPDLARRAIISDVRDKARIGIVFDRVKPDLVFHAAALKHVPIVEDNPLEGLRTNTLGSRVVADACRAAGVSCMVQISTDKAINPTNVMGASKRLAEAYIQALDTVSRQENGTRFVVVRFGNVLGSTGSVVPLFQKQLAAGGPLTVTHPEVTRYFMTVREAVELVLQASVLGLQDDSSAGRIFVLDMGQPVKIVDLARQIILLAGYVPDQDVKITFTGLRPGEKLYEELLHGEENQLPSVHDGIMLAAPRAGSVEALNQALLALEQEIQDGSRMAALQRLQRLVPEYQADERTLKTAAVSAADPQDDAVDAVVQS